MAKKKKPVALYRNFPTEIYLTREGADTEDGYYLQWENKKDAAENAVENDSQVAIYSLVHQGKATVTTTVDIS